MRRFIAIYQVGGQGGGTYTACMNVAAKDLDSAFHEWSRCAAIKHDTTQEEMESGFEGEPCFDLMIDDQMKVWEVDLTPGSGDQVWKEADTRSP